MLFSRKKKGISLRVLYVWIILAALLISGLMFYSTHSLKLTFNRLIDAAENQIALEKAAHELMDASDYLTERVQCFTVSGDMRFLNDYFTEVFETKRRENAITKMSGDPAVVSALEQLQQAMQDSVRLMNKEYYAMRLVTEAKGYSDIPEALKSTELTQEDAALSVEKKMKRATEIVLDNDYYEQKDRIRSEMKESLSALETLTRNTEQAVLKELQDNMNVIRIIILIQVLMMIIVVWLTLHLGIHPILKAVDRIKEDRAIPECGANEFRYLAHTYNTQTVKLNEENELLKTISQTDALTGLRNRMALRNDYDTYTNREVTVMMLDLDNFKRINDTCGHEEGDRILAETGKLLSDTFGKDYCYRFGGDEFLVILPDVSESEFLTKLRPLRENTPQLLMNGKPSPVGYSIGFSHGIPSKVLNLRDLFDDADQNMYADKRSKPRDIPSTRKTALEGA